MERDRGYAFIERAWTAGDVIEIKYPMKRRELASGNDRVAYWFGPWLLGASAGDNRDYFNELTVENRLMAGKDSSIPAGGPPRRFGVPVAATVVPVVPAEYPDQPSSVVLRPISEQTGQPTTSWELRFLTKKA
jgi:hypothetical protein